MINLFKLFVRKKINRRNHMRHRGIEGGYCHDLRVTIDGVWIGEWIYWPLVHPTRNYKHLQRYRWSNHYILNLLSLLSLVISWQRILLVGILQLLCSRCYCPASAPQLNCQVSSSEPPCRAQLSTDTWLTPRLAAISHQYSNLFFRGWLSTNYLLD
jgi:hypothetical protein